MFIWLRVSLCLMLAAPVGVRGFDFFQYLHFLSSLLSLGFPRNSLLNRVVIHWSRMGVVEGFVEGKHSIILKLNFRVCFFFLLSLNLWTVTLRGVS